MLERRRKISGLQKFEEEKAKKDRNENKDEALEEEGRFIVS
jgi:hypothetical protein